jgi:hypothetical protein
MLHPFVRTACDSALARRYPWAGGPAAIAGGADLESSEVH